MDITTRSLRIIGRFILSRGVQIMGIAVLLLFLVFFVIPLGYFLLLSFFTFIQSGRYEAAFTLSNYIRLAREPLYLRILGATFKMGAIVSVVCFTLGYPVAYYLGRSTSKLRNLVLMIVVASLFTNLVVRTYGWIVLLTENGLINNILMASGLVKEPLDLIFNMTGVVICEAQIQLPVFIMIVAGVIQLIDPDLDFAARVMGADDVQTFASVVWPLSLRGIIGGVSLVFALAISAFITPFFLSGGKIVFTALFINTLVTRSLNYPLAGALSMILVLSSVSVIVIMSWISKRYA